MWLSSRGGPSGGVSALDFGSTSSTSSASTAEDVGDAVERGGEAGCYGRDTVTKPTAERKA